MSEMYEWDLASASMLHHYCKSCPDFRSVGFGWVWTVEVKMELSEMLEKSRPRGRTVMW